MSVQKWIGVIGVACMALSASAQTNTFPASGNVGIGTTSPGAPLDVVGAVHSSVSGVASSFFAEGNDSSTNITSGTNTSLFLQNTSATPGNHAIIQGWDAHGNQQGSLGFLYGNHTGMFQASIFIEPRRVGVPSAFIVSSSGNVGIGTTTPSAKLEVNGAIKLTYASGGAITFQDGTIQSTAYTGVTCGGDFAESVNVSGDRKHYQPGDVLVLTTDGKNDVAKSSKPYSTLVAGIYSTKPGYVGRRQITPKSPDEVPMAMVGIVPTKVSAENGPIHRGDLLVTASLPGYAMKGTDRSQMLGAVIGKAMGKLDSGTGIIEVLVSLQ